MESSSSISSTHKSFKLCFLITISDSDTRYKHTIP